MGRFARKTRSRIENLLAWLAALGVLVLLGAGAFYLASVFGVVP
jgi:CHASE2 domain-containing sensor protein